jgi:hypothetical protein
MSTLRHGGLRVVCDTSLDLQRQHGSSYQCARDLPANTPTRPVNSEAQKVGPRRANDRPRGTEGKRP